MSGATDRRSAELLKWIIVGLTVIYILQMVARFLFGSSEINHLFGLSSTSINNFYFWTPLTYGFLHHTPGPLHLIFNLLVLYIFGSQITSLLSRDKFLLLFLGGIIVGGLLWLAFNIQGSVPLVGASAGVGAVVIFYCCYYANRDIQFFFIPISFKAKYLGWGIVILSLIFFFTSLDAGTLQSNSTRTAHEAHLGGYFWGWFFYMVLYPAKLQWSGRKNIPQQRVTWKRPIRPKAQGLNYKVNISSHDDLRQEVDRILDKINAHGFASLTEEEKKTLDQAKDLLKH